ncbi:MAG: hydrogenase iron-sulfur subunit [Thermoanaerobaculales bacterium]|jgi:quinone-modifying oxidoreductase subunit QmoB|nr:hydrogenase iron-sulfur subunit [Thermoanaerobaculales bacterium]
MDKLGVFLCTGCGIGDGVDVDEVLEAANEKGCTATLTHECLCGPEGIDAIRGCISENSLDGILLAACSERAKAPEFAPLSEEVPAVFRTAIREHCTWSHPADAEGQDAEDTTMLAQDLVRMGLARLSGMKPVEPLQEEISDVVLVVGSGRAGLEAALTASRLGHPVTLVEQGSKLGGLLADQVSIPPEEPPYDAPVPNPVPGLIAEIEADDRIQVLTDTVIAKITGQPGQMEVTFEGPETIEQTIGSIVQATGAKPYPADNLGHLGYGTSADIVTSYDFEKMLASGTIARPSDGKKPERIAFIQCAGSRDPDHLNYCSSECCVNTLRQVAEVDKIDPSIENAVIYRDIRAPGLMEHFFVGIQKSAGMMMTRGDVVGIEANGRLNINLSNSLLGDNVDVEADLVVLAVGMVPSSADGELIRELHDSRHQAEHSESSQVREASAKRAEELKDHEGTEILNLEYRQGPDLPTLKYGFPDSHFICFPYETRRTGIYAAGTVHAPMDCAQSAEDGLGAAMKAVQCIEMAKRGEAVHPRSGDTAYPDFFLQRCTQCKRCTEECPFGTINEDEKGTPQFNPLRCRRCGICMGACPERIISFQDYSVHMVAEMIKSMSIPEDYEEKPRILAIMCENDAVPALEAAAADGATWNPWVRVIPVRCLGSTNIVWIAEALSAGVDGVILIGCKYGDDYQCHYVRGSELANTRLGNVGETLQRLALEPERIKVVELSHDEFDRVPKVLDEFAEELDEMGPNPLKGF